MNDPVNDIALGLVLLLFGLGLVPVFPMIARRHQGKVWMPALVGIFGLMGAGLIGLGLHGLWKALTG